MRFVSQGLAAEVGSGSDECISPNGTTLLATVGRSGSDADTDSGSDDFDDCYDEAEVRASGYTALGGFRQHSAWNHWCFPFKRPNNVADISKRGQVAALAEAAGRLRRLEAFQAALEPIIGAGDGGYTRPYLTRCWPAPARDPWLTQPVLALRRWLRLHDRAARRRGLPNGNCTGLAQILGQL